MFEIEALEKYGIDVAGIEASIIAYLPRIAIAIAILVLGVICVRVVNKIMQKFEERVIKRTKTELDDVLFSHARIGVRYTIYCVAGILAAKVLMIEILAKVILACLVILLIIPTTGIADALLSTVEERLTKRTKTKVDDMAVNLLKKAVKYSIYVFAGVIALDVLGINVAPLLAGMGIAGIAVGFAAKDTLSNVIGGIQIIIDRPFQLGDRIEIWSAPKQQATWGDVIDIGLRSTKIRTTDNLVIIIPNSEIMKRDIINYTTLSPDIRLRIPLGIAYEANIKKAEEVLLKIANETEGVLKKPEPKVIVKKFGESSIDLELRVWIENARLRRTITSETQKRIKEEFDKSGIEIPYPMRHIILEEKKK
jgi:small-conductance mechanosensitive channel